MPKEPQAQTQAADAIDVAVMVSEIASDELDDCENSSRVISGANARTITLTGEQRREQAKLAARARWGRVNN